MEKSDCVERTHLGKCPVDSVSLDNLLPLLDKMINDGSKHYVCFCESNVCARANREPSFLEILNNASLVLPDGVSAQIGIGLSSGKMPERLTAPLVLREFSRYSVNHGTKHFFYGGAEGVADQLAENLRKMIPELKVVGTFCPPFRELTEDEEAFVKNKIEASGADVVWVGLGAPKQEIWMVNHVGKINAPLMLGIGATFDWLSNKTKRAPSWLRKLGLEWLFRMLTGGRRLFFRNIQGATGVAAIILQEIHKRVQKRTAG
jgi:N-acetylglucosaminyldiphosphoundecaprenol N-acetyl-beta-D-mannosaminyltransferase